MRAIVQRVKGASVVVHHQMVGSIEKGLLVVKGERVAVNGLDRGFNSLDCHLTLLGDVRKLSKGILKNPRRRVTPYPQPRQPARS